MTTNNANGYYFWLGENGEIDEVSLEEFIEKQHAIKKERNDWINLRTSDDEDR